MVVKQFKGRGRRAIISHKPQKGGWLFRLYMAWFMRGIGKS